MDRRAHEGAVVSAVKEAAIDVADPGGRRLRSRAGPVRARAAAGQARRTPGSSVQKWAATEQSVPGLVRWVRRRPRGRDAGRTEDGDDLARAVADGDAHTALPLLVDRYGLDVYRHCRRMLFDDADGDDVSQIVFIQAFEAIQRRQRIDNVRAYLLGIARYRCLDRLALRRSGPIPVDSDQLERAIESQAPGESPICDSRVCQVLDECLDELDPRSRMVLLLRFHDGLAYAEISKLTGDRPGALRVRVARALRLLRGRLERRNIRFETPETDPNSGTG